MTIEALVKPSFPRIVGAPWVLKAHHGYTSGATIIFHEITVPVESGHRYRVTVSASGMAPCEGTKYRVYMIGTGAETLASQRVGFDRGGFAGLMSVPIALCGMWTATGGGNVAFAFAMTRADATGDADWELTEAVHQMFVEDLGPP